MKAATFAGKGTDDADRISIHAAREGGDDTYPSQIVNRAISIHAAREGGDPLAFKLRIRFEISIHAAREGGDSNEADCSDAPSNISIHAAREGGDTAKEGK